MNRKKSQGVLFCLPGTCRAFNTAFIFVPTVKVFKMSLYRMGGITNKKEFVGFENFTKLFQAEETSKERTFSALFFTSQTF